MVPEEQLACTEWLRMIMAEHAGKAIRSGTQTLGSTSGVIGVTYKTPQFERTLRVYLPEDVCARIEAHNPSRISYWCVWPQLSDADIGTIMQAGAALFLNMEAPL